MLSLRRDLIRLLSEGGQGFEISTTWENATKSKRHGLFVIDEYSVSSWFFIKDNMIWFLTYNSSDGGAWNANGPLVSGYKAPYTDAIKNKVNALFAAKQAASIKNNGYLKHKRG